LSALLYASEEEMGLFGQEMADRFPGVKLEKREDRGAPDLRSFLKMLLANLRQISFADVEAAFDLAQLTRDVELLIGT